MIRRMKYNHKDDFHETMNHGWVLTNKQIDHINKYPLFYNAWAGSYLELMFFQKFWIYLSKSIPNFIAPSTLTFLGLIFNLIATFTVLYHSPDFKNNELPAYVLLLSALCTFLYQTLDALDGKQAYKVQNTAIEELSDHSCDAISTVLMSLSFSAIVQLGNNQFLLLTFLIVSLTAFFFTHFVSHVTHSMIFGKIDVTEGMLCYVVLCILTAILGQKIWLLNILEFSSYKLNTGNAFILFSICILMFSIYQNIKISLMGQLTPIEKVGINIPRRKIVWSTYNSIFAITFLICFCYINFFYGIMQQSPLVFLFTYGFSFAKIIIILVLINVSKGHFEILNTSLIAPSLLTINCMLSYYFNDFFINCYTALLCSLIWTLMDGLRYLTYAIWDIKSALDVNVFSIKYPVGHSKNRAGSWGFYLNGLNNEQVLKDWKKFSKKSNELFKVF